MGILDKLFARKPKKLAHLFGGIDPKSRRYFPSLSAKAAWEKDPQYYDAIPGSMPVGDFPDYWKAKYPEDFPEGGLTAVDDVTAIKPKSIQQERP